jgi:hypothetical protein
MKRDVYVEVSERILAELERGATPWVKPWSATPGQNVPQNAVSNRPYSGCNVILLWLARNRGWATPRFLTFKQAIEAGGNVLKGEHGTKPNSAALCSPIKRSGVGVPRRRLAQQVGDVGARVGDGAKIAKRPDQQPPAPPCRLRRAASSQQRNVTNIVDMRRPTRPSMALTPTGCRQKAGCEPRVFAICSHWAFGAGLF